VLAAPRHILRLDRGELEELERSGTPYESRQAAAMIGFGTTELLVIALLRRGQGLGVLSLGSRGAAFTDADLQDFTTVAAYLSVALDAARMHATQTAVATAIQTTLLPPLPVVAGLRLAARYEPAARGIDVGGDWYDAFPGSRGLTIVIGDTAGHDVDAAASMAALRNLLRGHAVDREESPAEVLARLDRTAFALQLDALATCLIGHLEPTDENDWRLTWSSAGHLPPVKLRANRAELLETPADLMLGVDRHAPRVDHVTDLVPGDVLLLFTDGLIEVPGLALDGRLELLRSTVEGCVDCAPDELCDLLVREFMSQAIDDVAIFALDVVARSAPA
jgi:serine phosphatase RsbU (regulator of sigma subunit)